MVVKIHKSLDSYNNDTNTILKIAFISQNAIVFKVFEEADSRGQPHGKRPLEDDYSGVFEVAAHKSEMKYSKWPIQYGGYIPYRTFVYASRLLEYFPK